jgi:hypothetical protein
MGLQASIPKNVNTEICVKRLIKQKPLPSLDQFLGKLEGAQTIDYLTELSLIRGGWGDSVSLEEINVLWNLGLSMQRGGTELSDFFKQILIVYFSGEVIGRDILSFYNFYKKRDKKKYIFDSKRIQELILHRIQSMPIPEASNQYSTFVQYILGQLNASAIRKYLRSKGLKAAIEQFNAAVILEYAMLLIKQYTKTKISETKQILVAKMGAIPAKVLILAGQRFMSQNKADSFSRAIVAYTIAASRNDKFQKQLGFLIQSLIRNNCAKDFERLVP